MQINTGIIIAFLVFLLLSFSIGFAIIIYYFGRRSIKNDSSKALILVKNGLNVDRVFQGKLHEVGRQGVSFRYDKSKFIFVPGQYQEVYHRQKRLLFINQAGRLIALPFVADKPLTEEESTNLIYEMCSTHIGADGMRALKGKNNTNTILVAIIAFVVGMAAVVVFNQISTHQQPQQQQSQQQQSSTPTIIKGAQK